MDAPLPGAKPGAAPPAAPEAPAAAPAEPASEGASDAKGWTVFMDAPPSPPAGAPGSVPQGPMEFAKPSASPSPSESNSSMMVGGGASSVSTSGEVQSSDSGNAGGEVARSPSVRTNLGMSQSGSSAAPASMEAGRAAPVADPEEGGSGKVLMWVVIVAAAGAAIAYFTMM